jgi:hypothetical protein
MCRAGVDFGYSQCRTPDMPSINIAAIYDHELIKEWWIKIT